MDETEYLLSAAVNAERLLRAVRQLEAADLQRKYVRKRRARMRKIGIPFKGFEAPEPGELDAEDPENG